MMRLAQNNKVNITYELSGYLIEKPDANTLKLIKPNPRNLKKNIEHSGKISPEGEKDRFGLYENLADTSLAVLHYIGMSFFHYTFATPIKGNEQRWIRLFFHPQKTATFPPNRTKHFLLWLIDSLRFTYTIMGPIDVKNIFEERINIHRHVTEMNLKKYPELKDQFEDQLRGVTQLEQHIIANLKRNEPTKIGDLTLHIFPHKLRTLESLYTFGKIEPNGTMPNFLPVDERLPSTSSWARRVYDWSTKDFSGCDDSFYIFFTGKVQNRILRILAFFVIGYVILKEGIYSFSSLVQVIDSYFDIKTFQKFQIALEKINKSIFLEYPIIGFILSIFALSIFSYIKKLIKTVGKWWKK